MPETTNPKPNIPERKKTADSGEKFFQLFKEILETQNVIISKIDGLSAMLPAAVKQSGDDDAWGRM